MNKITIIGAGIGGLTTAIALRRKGFEVEIFEHTPQFTEAGSGINLALNAMQIFKHLGISEKIEQSGHPLEAMNVRDLKLDLLASSPIKELAALYSVRAVAIHRARLHSILLDELEDTPVYLNKKLRSLCQKGEQVELVFEDGTTHTAAIVIGADGIRSVVREAVVPEAKSRDAGQICWRGISKATLAEAFQKELNEIWGVGSRFGFVPISSDEVYWFALIRKDKRNNLSENGLSLFKNYPQVVQQILGETPEEAIICNEIWDLKPIDIWYKGSIVLLGDAAHATTPNLGQGACQAVESAYVLAECLASEQDISLAFEKYRQQRIAKAHYVVRTSWALGKMAQLEKSWACSLRNFLMKRLPQTVADRQSKRLYALDFKLR